MVNGLDLTIKIIPGAKVHWEPGLLTISPHIHLPEDRGERSFGQFWDDMDQTTTSKEEYRGCSATMCNSHILTRHLMETLTWYDKKIFYSNWHYLVGDHVNY